MLNFKLVAASSSPEFSKFPVSEMVRDFVREAIIPDKALSRLLAAIFKSAFDKIFLELVIADVPEIVRFSREEISPRFTRESLRFKSSFFAE